MSKSKPTNSLLEYRKADSKTEEEFINIIKPIISGVFLNDDFDFDFALGYRSVYHLILTYNKADTIKEILIDAATTYFGTETIDLNGVSYLKKVMCVYYMCMYYFRTHLKFKEAKDVVLWFNNLSPKNNL